MAPYIALHYLQHAQRPHTHAIALGPTHYRPASSVPSLPPAFLAPTTPSPQLLGQDRIGSDGRMDRGQSLSDGAWTMMYRAAASCCRGFDGDAYPSRQKPVSPGRFQGQRHIEVFQLTQPACSALPTYALLTPAARVWLTIEPGARGPWQYRKKYPLPTIGWIVQQPSQQKLCIISGGSGMLRAEASWRSPAGLP
jgi:hypothetical protein